MLQHRLCWHLSCAQHLAQRSSQPLNQLVISSHRTPPSTGAQRPSHTVLNRCSTAIGHRPAQLLGSYPPAQHHAERERSSRRLSARRTSHARAGHSSQRYGSPTAVSCSEPPSLAHQPSLTSTPTMSRIHPSHLSHPHQHRRDDAVPLLQHTSPGSAARACALAASPLKPSQRPGCGSSVATQRQGQAPHQMYTQRKNMRGGASERRDGRQCEAGRRGGRHAPREEHGGLARRGRFAVLSLIHI